MGYEEVNGRNKNFPINKIMQETFREYGIVHKYNVLDVIEYMEKNAVIPASGNIYTASDAGLENLLIIQRISQELFGGLETEAGPCIGHNTALTGMEYHQGSEIIIAVTDCVIIIGKRQDMIENTYNGDKAKAFYVEKGQTVELFSTTLHYTPCKVEDYFATVVILLKGTNDPLDKSNGILMKKNKWFITHPEVKAKVEAGNFPGLLGDMIELQ